MQDFEKLGVFYLGRQYDLDAQKPSDDLLLYDAKDLTTHAVCVGMTGSGKTGLCLALLEEAAIDGIPAIAIDPKGDLANLLLTFPELRGEDFRPWVDAGEASRRGVSVEQLADETAKQWRDGLAEWGEDGARIARFRDAVDVAVYTPGSNAGLPLSVLRSLSAGSTPGQDPEALRERISGAVSGLLGLLGVDADPLQSREHILLSNILDTEWRAGRDVEPASLIRAIQTPPFDKVGFVDLESFFPAKERFALAMRLNNLLASPAFSSWMQGEPLDIARMLNTPQGKPRLSIISIAHLSDAERMFFVTLLLNEMVAWMRRQSGTSSLRALLYMDEVFGYFPPTANPPSKTPMLTLLKQARAFGLGVVLATQNPVDLDYKGLSNAGTWLIGRLQTERDKARVLEGLEGASAAAGSAFDRGQMDTVISGLGKRVFLMNNVHENAPVVFQTRWTLSYLRGPIGLEQVRQLMSARKSAAAAKTPDGSPATATSSAAAGTGSSAATPTTTATATQTTTSSAADAGPRPVLPPGVTERFLACRAAPDAGRRLVYRPALYASSRVHFVQAKLSLDYWEEVHRYVLVNDDGAVPGDVWDRPDVPAGIAGELATEAEQGGQYAKLPAELTRPQQYTRLATALKDHLYRQRKLPLWQCATLKQVSAAGESEGDFRVRLSLLIREERDRQIEKLRSKYGTKFATLEDRLNRAEAKVAREQAQSSQQTLQTAVSIGTSLLRGLFGRKIISGANIGRAGTSARAAGRAVQQRGDVAQAEQAVVELRQQRADLDDEMEAEIARIRNETSAEAIPLDEVPVQPRKADIAVSEVVLAWTPWSVGADGDCQPAY